MIHLKNIGKCFQGKNTKKVVLEGLSWDFHQGEKTLIFGASGSGKSTLLNIIGLIDRNFSGNYQLNHIDVSKINSVQAARYRNKFFGYIQQEPMLLEKETTFENVRIPLYYSDSKDVSHFERVMDVLERVKLNDKADQIVSTLSGGERQRVAIARALINDAKLILADEPTASLDEHLAEEILDLLKVCLGDTRMLIMVTHDERLISDYWDHILLLEKGQLYKR